MRRLLITAALLALAGCGKAPYEIVDRKTEGPGELVVTIRADVPADATHEQMQAWCKAITDDEGEDKFVSVEFLKEGPIVQQKGFCAGGRMVFSQEKGFSQPATR